MKTGEKKTSFKTEPHLRTGNPGLEFSDAFIACLFKDYTDCSTKQKETTVWASTEHIAAWNMPEREREKEFPSHPPILAEQ